MKKSKQYKSNISLSKAIIQQHISSYLKSQVTNTLSMLVLSLL